MTDLRQQIEEAWTSAASENEPQRSDPQTNVATSEDNETAAAEPVEVITAPNSYTKEAKDWFATIDHEHQKYLAEREKQFEQGLSRARNQYSWVDKIYTDRKDALTNQGYQNTQDYISDLVLMHDALNKNPSATIDLLKQSYGIGDGSTQDNALQRQVQSLIETVGRQQTELNRQQEERITNALREFLDAKDEAGNPKHPYINDVKDEMVKLFNANLAKNYEDAYNQAIWRVESVRDKIIASKAGASVQEKANAAAKAKTAAFDPSSKSVATPKKLDLREELERNYDKYME